MDTSDQKGTYQFRILNLDEYKSAWREGERYLPELPGPLFELLEGAFFCTYLNVLNPEKVRRRTHLEITQLAWDVELLINKYLNDMRACEQDDGIPEGETEYARFMLSTSCWLGQLSGTIRYPKEDAWAAGEPADNATAMNLHGAAALMDIDEGLALEKRGKPSEALECFLGAAEGARAASVIEAFDTAISELAGDGHGGLTAERATQLARLRHRPNHQLREYALKLYGERSCKNKHQAAKTIRPQVIAYARQIGARLSEDRAFRTIYEWLLKAKIS